MKRLIWVLFLSLTMLVQSTFAFDEDKAKKDYYGANFEVSSIKEELYENAPAITITFTVPLSKDRIKEHYIELEGGESDHWILSEDRTKIIFPFVQPNTHYTVKLKSEIRNVNKKKLKKPKTETVQTKEVVPSVNFTSSAHILSSSSPKKLPITTLNIDEVNIDFFAIDIRNVPNLIQNVGENGKRDYYILDRIRNIGELAHSGRFELNPRKNQRTEYNINLAEIESLNKPGVYAAVMSVPGSYNYQNEYVYFMQTNLGLHVRRYKEKFDVYSQDITSGKPLENVEIKVLDANGGILKEKKTDALGRTGFYQNSSQYFIVASKGDQVSILPIQRNMLDLSGLKNAVTTHSEYQIYSWGPRELYRPGEIVDINTLVRN